MADMWVYVQNFLANKSICLDSNCSFVRQALVTRLADANSEALCHSFHADAVEFPNFQSSLNLISWDMKPVDDTSDCAQVLRHWLQSLVMPADTSGTSARSIGCSVLSALVQEFIDMKDLSASLLGSEAPESMTMALLTSSLPVSFEI